MNFSYTSQSRPKLWVPGFLGVSGHLRHPQCTTVRLER